jgi:uncharacterized protein
MKRFVEGLDRAQGTLFPERLEDWICEDNPVRVSGELSRKLRQLDDFLCSGAVGDDAMPLSELDGFLAGLIVCPDMIMPSEWMPVVWGDEGPVFESEHRAQTVIDLIMEHYNDIIRQLDRGAYRPIHDVDIDDSILWELWFEGFWQAMRLRPEAWRALAQNEDADLQRALFVLGRLGELATDPNNVDSMDIDEELEGLAPDLIPPHVEIPHRTRRTHASPFTTSANENRTKVGRNEPCPCGSGKKFKNRCLN